MKALIVGFGKAGKDLHLECLKKYLSSLGEAEFIEEVGVVDPQIKKESRLLSTKSFSSISAAKSFDPEETVIHICTPPTSRLDILREGVRFGYKHYIIEKPLALSLPEAEGIIEIERENNLKIAVVSPWLSSPLMMELRAMIREEKLGRLLSVVVRHDKPRFVRSLSNGAHSTAFDVELPHGLGIAFSLAGLPNQIVASHCYDFAIDTSVVPHMGGAGLACVHENAIISLVSSNLMATERTRTVSVACEDGTAILHLPTSGEDSHSCLRMFNASGDLLEFKRCLEEPLVRALKDYYEYFRGLSNKPESNTQLHSAIVMAVVQGKLSCGLVCNGMTHHCPSIKGSASNFVPHRAQPVMNGEILNPFTLINGKSSNLQ